MGEQPFSKKIIEVADSMGISLYQRFSVQEASLFLRCSADAVNKIIKQRKLAYIQLPNNDAEFFGFQLLEYLLGQVKHASIPSTKNSETKDRILRSHELQDMTGLSRTTIWRLERKGEFPDRVPLSANSVGWRLSDVEKWIRER